MSRGPYKARARRPRDQNQLAKLIVDIATGERQDAPEPTPGKDPAAVALGRKGGLKGGKARAESLTAAQRSEIAKRAAKKRWAVIEPPGGAADPKAPRRRKVLSPDPD
jgi:hypothetical protein